jgi:hypothetical protein
MLYRNYLLPEFSVVNPNVCIQETVSMCRLRCPDMHRLQICIFDQPTVLVHEHQFLISA